MQHGVERLSGWRTPRWLASSVRNKLLAMALLPLLVAFPLLVEGMRETLSTEKLAERIARMVADLEKAASGRDE